LSPLDLINHVSGPILEMKTSSSITLIPLRDLKGITAKKENQQEKRKAYPSISKLLVALIKATFIKSDELSITTVSAKMTLGRNYRVEKLMPLIKLLMQS
jgi:hypothetical protein